MIQAAISLIPFTNEPRHPADLIPPITSTISSFPFSRRQCLSAHCASLKTIVKQADRAAAPYLKSRQGSKDAERPFYIRDSQRPLAGICELELAAILRTQPSANRLLKRDLRQGAFRPILYRHSCRQYVPVTATDRPG